MDKQALKAAMLALEAAELQEAREHYEAYLQESRLAENEPHERDEMASARIAADLAHGFDAPIHDHEAKIMALRDMDFAPRDSVGPGAVVSWNGRNFVVAVATQRFEVDGETYMGISMDSPVYRKIDGLAAGETFEMNGIEITLDRVV
ncbi:MAG: Protein of unknown function (DUF2924) [Rhodobacteraceae bacterium HLUCCA08]|nr:MAG: Protein of unknown function (DUF2924) [Rhodobacteraceae bacterium HLUCCA08]